MYKVSYNLNLKILMQKGYFTPIKNVYSQHKKTNNSDVTHR